jgi:hypothetical protein
MKLPRRWIGVGVAVALISPFGISASDGVAVTLVITVAKQDDSPVQIVGFKLPARVGAIPAIVIRNTTAKEIRLLSFTNYVGNPRGVGGAEPKWGGNLGMRHTGDPLPRTLGPNATSEFPEEALRPYDAGFWAHRLQSNCLHAAFYIARVDFADGTVWRWDQPGTYETVTARLLAEWKDSIRPESTKGCDDSLATQGVLGHLDGTCWPPLGGLSNASAEIVPFFAFSCPIRDDVARCQM